jgi:hypothetical protein
MMENSCLRVKYRFRREAGASSETDRGHPQKAGDINKIKQHYTATLDYVHAEKTVTAALK